MEQITSKNHLPIQIDFRQFFSEIPCYITVLDSNLRIFQINRLFEKEFGKRLGDCCFEVYKKRVDPCPECPAIKTFATGQVCSDEGRVITKDGEEAWVIAYTSPIRNNKGEIVSVMVMSTNITQIKNLQTELNMMVQTVAGMAHGIKNILAGLDGGIYVVNSGITKSDYGRLLKGWDIVQRNVSRIANLTKDILYCSREREHPLELINPNEVVLDVFELFREITTLENIKLTHNLDSRLSKILLNAEDLHTILSNLVHNALEACKFDTSRRNHKIHILTKKRGPLAIFEVHDSGPGLPEEFKDQLFSEIISSKGSQGTGLGLLVTYKIVNELGGKITFASYPNSGSTFRVSFPIKREI